MTTLVTFDLTSQPLLSLASRLLSAQLLFLPPPSAMVLEGLVEAGTHVAHAVKVHLGGTDHGASFHAAHSTSHSGIDFQQISRNDHAAATKQLTPTKDQEGTARRLKPSK